jgi:hypothetical protein
METTDRSQKNRGLKKDASNFDDYMLAAFLITLVGVLIVL